MEKTKIDPEKIPETVMEEFCRMILEDMRDEALKNGGLKNEKSNVA